jgi:hypothetical protein
MQAIRQGRVLRTSSETNARVVTVAALDRDRYQQRRSNRDFSHPRTAAALVD